MKSLETKSIVESIKDPDQTVRHTHKLEIECTVCHKTTGSMAWPILSEEITVSMNGHTCFRQFRDAKSITGSTDTFVNKFLDRYRTGTRRE